MPKKTSRRNRLLKNAPVVFDGKENDARAKETEARFNESLSEQTRVLEEKLDKNSEEAEARHEKSLAHTTAAKEELKGCVEELKETLVCQKQEAKAKEIAELELQLQEEKESKLKLEMEALKSKEALKAQEEILKAKDETIGVLVQSAQKLRPDPVPIPETVSIGDKTAATPTSLDSMFASTEGSVPKEKHEALKLKADFLEKENRHISIENQDLAGQLRLMGPKDPIDVQPVGTPQTEVQKRAFEDHTNRLQVGRQMTASNKPLSDLVLRNRRSSLGTLPPRTPARSKKQPPETPKGSKIQPPSDVSLKTPTATAPMRTRRATRSASKPTK